MRFQEANRAAPFDVPRGQFLRNKLEGEQRLELTVHEELRRFMTQPDRDSSEWSNLFTLQLLERILRMATEAGLPICHPHSDDGGLVIEDHTRPDVSPGHSEGPCLLISWQVHASVRQVMSAGRDRAIMVAAVRELLRLYRIEIHPESTEHVIKITEAEPLAPS